MNEELWASVERKMRGYLESAKHLGTTCETCGEWLNPTDTGVDPTNGIRYWVTYCCGNVHRYEEKLTGFGVVLDDL
jgi:RNase P subunit RPR2